MLLYHGALGDGQGIGGVTHEHPVGVDGDVLIRDDVGQGGPRLDHGALHQDAVDHLGALFHDDAAGEDGVFHLALDVAAVRHQGALGDGVGAVVGGGVGHVLGADGTGGVEQVVPDGGV